MFDWGRLSGMGDGTFRPSSRRGGTQKKDESTEEVRMVLVDSMKLACDLLR